MKNKRLSILIVMFVLMFQSATSSANKENTDRIVEMFGGGSQPEKIKNNKNRLAECSNLNKEFKEKALKFNESREKTKGPTQNIKSLENKINRADKELDRYSKTYEICEKKYNPYGNGIPRTENVSKRCTFVRLKTEAAIELMRKSRFQYNEIIKENKAFYDEQRALFSRLEKIQEKMIVNECPQLKN